MHYKGKYKKYSAIASQSSSPTASGYKVCFFNPISLVVSLLSIQFGCIIVFYATGHITQD